MKKFLMLFVLAAPMLFAQINNGGGSGTGITQSATVPATCTVGDVYFHTTTTGGAIGLYECRATNTWSGPPTVGGGITNVAANLHLMESDGTNAIDSDIVRSTNDYTFPGAVVATTSFGAGTAPTACGSATGCWAATGGATASTQTVGQGSVRLDSTSGNWLLRQQNGASELAIATLVASGTSAMGTGAIASGACATVVTTAATGAATTDNLIATPTTDASGVTGYAVSATGSLYIQAYLTANNVNFKVCNNTSGSLTPGALTMQWRVIR